MRITKKLVKIGNSIGIIIDKPILKKLKTKVDDLVEINIKKVDDEKTKNN